MAKDGMVSVNIENTDLSATLTEYAQENANLRLTQKALIRRVSALQIELAAATKKDEKTETQPAGNNGVADKVPV